MFFPLCVGMDTVFVISRYFECEGRFINLDVQLSNGGGLNAAE